jgi:hypothetical protein
VKYTALAMGGGTEMPPDPEKSGFAAQPQQKNIFYFRSTWAFFYVIFSADLSLSGHDAHVRNPSAGDHANGEEECSTDKVRDSDQYFQG